MIDRTEVLRQARHLRGYAEHFVQRDWNYTRKTSIKHIRYEDAYQGYDHPWKRIKRTLKQFSPFHQSNLDRLLGVSRWDNLRRPLVVIRVWLMTEPHRPDGWLDEGGIITHWEETGEYLQYVQPSVGSLIADLMEAEPENSHVQKIAAEMKRIADSYTERLKADGELVTYEVVPKPETGGGPCSNCGWPTTTHWNYCGNCGAYTYPERQQ